MPDTLKLGSLGHDVRTLQTLLNALGADLTCDAVFGPLTKEAVCDFQRSRNLVEDGIVGPKTWQAIDDALARMKIEMSIAAERPKTDEDLRIAGEAAVENALAYWSRDIYDPKFGDGSAAAAVSKAVITGFIRQGLGWTWEDNYDGDGDFEWCGAFAAACWADSIKPNLRRDYFSSTYRLDRYASYRAALPGQVPDAIPESGYRTRVVMDGQNILPPIDVRPGDILLIGRKSYGHHIALVEQYVHDDAEPFYSTIEGNAFGQTPSEKRRQGVVRCRRSYDEVRRIIRPGVGDLL